MISLAYLYDAEVRDPAGGSRLSILSKRDSEYATEELADTGLRLFLKALSRRSRLREANHSGRITAANGAESAKLP